MPNLAAIAAGLGALTGVVKTLTDPEITGRVVSLACELRNRPRTDRLSDYNARIQQLGEHIGYLATVVDTDREREQIQQLRARLTRIQASTQAAGLAASSSTRRKLLKRMRGAIDQLSTDVIVMLVGEDTTAPVLTPGISRPLRKRWRRR